MWYGVNDTLKINGLCYNFLPSWWNRNYGVTFGEKYVFNPGYRVELLMFMERTVRQRFPELSIGSEQPEPPVAPPDFHNTITAGAAGCEVMYPDDNYPWNRHLSSEKIPKLKVPENLTEIFPYREVISQIVYLNRKFGKDIQPVLNSRGVLNDAVLIGGSEFLGDFAQDTRNAKILLNFSYGMLKSVVSNNHLRFGYKGLVMLTNCTILMVSPMAYDKKLLGFDQNIYNLASGFAQEFGIHHCGIFDKYISNYRNIPRLNFLEIGWGSDIGLVLKMFPEAVVQYIFNAVFVKSANRKKITEKMKEILEAAKGNWHRFRLSMPDIEFGTPDENLNEIHACCTRNGNSLRSLCYE